MGLFSFPSLVLRGYDCGGDSHETKSETTVSYVRRTAKYEIIKQLMENF